MKSIEGVPLDSTHWWGPETNFFATRLAQDLFTVQGGIYADPKDPIAIKKFRDGGKWDQEANINLLREKYVVSSPAVSRADLKTTNNAPSALEPHS